MSRSEEEKPRLWVYIYAIRDFYGETENKFGLARRENFPMNFCPKLTPAAAAKGGDGDRAGILEREERKILSETEKEEKREKMEEKTKKKYL
ncbi:hypothetical protein V6N13_141091 [Hibiscus sabdariffa]